MNFQTRLRIEREKIGLSMKQVSEVLNINKSTYAYWECGVLPSKPEIYLLLARYFEVHPLYLMFGKEVEYEYSSGNKA